MAQKRFDTAIDLVVDEEPVLIKMTGSGTALEIIDHTDTQTFSISHTGSVVFSSIDWMTDQV